MIGAEDKLRIIELRAQGCSIRSIAKKVGLSKQTVADTIREEREQIATLEAINLEALYEAQRITATERIKHLSDLYAKIRKEVEERDLSDVSTEKLVDMFLKTSTQVSENMIEPEIRSSQEQQEEKGERRILDQYSDL